MRSYFQTLFSRGNVEVYDVVTCVERKVTDAHNASLVSPFTAQEVKKYLVLYGLG